MVNQVNSKRVTIKDVAKDADVSFAAVSKVIRGAYGVSDALRAKVNASIEKLGYTHNTAARSMRGQTFVIGVIFPDMRNPFFADILSGVSLALERTAYQSVQGIVRHSTEAALANSMIGMQLDGLILVGSLTSSDALSSLGKRKPLVTIGHHLPDVANLDTVNNDDEESGRVVVRHLVEEGYRKIAMLSLDTVNGTVIDKREKGYREGMALAGLADAVHVLRTTQSLREIQLAAKEMLTQPDRPDAIFCWTDFVALEVISVAQSLGLMLPDDLAIVGHDNTIYCDFRQNSLTSIDQSGEQLGQQAARLLIERIEGRQKSEHLLLHPRLVARMSSAPVEAGDRT